MNFFLDPRGGVQLRAKRQPLCSSDNPGISLKSLPERLI
jgi:hypothetical protein